MPKVKTKSGKEKHYPYTKKGKVAAKKARKRARKR